MDGACGFKKSGGVSLKRLPAQPSYETAKLINSALHLLSLQSYTMRFHYRTVTELRDLPPRWRIIGEEKDYRSSTDRYLAKVDKSLQEAQSQSSYGGANDIVALVFGNQAMTHEVTSRQLAHIIEERRAMTQRHLKEVQWRLDELLERKPFRRQGPVFPDDASLTDVERQILMLEFQKRALELDLWRDTQEPRTNLVNERRERETTRRRIGYLAGGELGGA